MTCRRRGSNELWRQRGLEVFPLPQDLLDEIHPVATNPLATVANPGPSEGKTDHPEMKSEGLELSGSYTPDLDHVEIFRGKCCAGQARSLRPSVE